MVVAVMGDDERAELESRLFTYADVGATGSGSPVGYHQFTQTISLAGGTDFEAAADLLMSWQVQARAGLVVRASALRVTEQAVVLMRLGYGPVSVSIPCRVVYAVNEPDRRGFAYGTLTGHPESGEELFLLERDDMGAISFTIRAFSRPASLLVKLGGPISRSVQRVMTKRYLQAL